jgi:alpha-L-arabinofuranosidase
MLDASATRDAQGRELTIAVVNRDRDHAQATTLQLTSATKVTAAVAYEVNAESPNAVNSFEHPHTIDVQERRLDLNGSDISYTFAPHSLTVLRLNLA